MSVSPHTPSLSDGLPIPTLLQSALRGLACKCPRCGEGKLFAGFLTLRPRCDRCDLDFSFVDAGDGPAVFIILIAGFIVVACALIVEMRYQPPFWVHGLLWGPLVLITTLGALRPMKSLLVALQFHHRAAEGQLVRAAADAADGPQPSDRERP